MSWTDDRIEKLEKLWAKGLSASQIASQIGDGVTRNAVIGKAHRLGLKSRPSPVKSDPKKPKKPAPKPIAAAVSEDRVSLLQLNERICKWPIGHPGDDDFHFCGRPSEAGHPYCGAHCEMAYQAQAPRKDRPRQKR